MALATRKNTTRTAVDAMYGKAANGVTSSSAGATCYRASTASSHPESTDLADAHRSPHAGCCVLETVDCGSGAHGDDDSSSAETDVGSHGSLHGWWWNDGGGDDASSTASSLSEQTDADLLHLPFPPEADADAHRSLHSRWWNADDDDDASSATSSLDALADTDWVDGVTSLEIAGDDSSSDSSESDAICAFGRREWDHGSTVGYGAFATSDASLSLLPPAGCPVAQIDLGKVAGAVRRQADGVNITARLSQHVTHPLLPGKLTLHPLGTNDAAGTSGTGTGNCPFCGCSTEGLGVRSACYMPRARSDSIDNPPRRQSNALAAWHRSLGYSGPRYCKLCAESLSSHLLRKGTRLKSRSHCSRESPCQRCLQILRHFDANTGEIYARADALKRKRCAERKNPNVPVSSTQTRHSRRRLLQRTCSPTGSNGANADCELNPATKVQQHNTTARSQTTIKAIGVILASVIVCGVMFRSRGGDPEVPMTAPIGGDTSWLCPSTASDGPASDNVETSQFAWSRESPCNSQKNSTLFSCDVNDCYDKAHGRVSVGPVGPRLCRCDGCVHTGGRCAAWELLGQTSSDASCATVDDGSGGEAWPPAGISYSSYYGFEYEETWRVIMWTGASDRASNYHSQAERFSSSSVHMLSFPPFSTTRDTAAHPMLWNFEPESRVWTRTKLEPSASSSPVALPTRVNHAWWSDSTGALFIFGGMNVEGRDDLLLGRQPVKSSDDKEQGTSKRRLADNSALSINNVWRFDPHSVAWTEIQNTAGTRNESRTELQQWPSLRMGHSMWSENRPSTSIDSNTGRASGDGEHVTWMFGGVPISSAAAHASTIVSAAVDVSTQLWRFSYHYKATTPSERVVDRWQWLLITEQAQGKSQFDYSSQQQHPTGDQPPPPRLSPVTPCFDSVDDYAGRERQCPAGRIQAATWKRATDLGGWLFGGDSWVGSGSIRYLGSSLCDLWRFNGDAQHPIWTQILPDIQNPRWPPPWSAPVGWAAQSTGTGTGAYTASRTTSSAGTDEREEGDQDEELWLVAGAGRTDEGYQTPDENAMWRFSLASGTWETFSSSGAWLSRRTLAAAVPTPGGRGGLLFGGFGKRGCGPEETQALPGQCPPGQLTEWGCMTARSTLWSWQS